MKKILKTLAVTSVIAIILCGCSSKKDIIESSEEEPVTEAVTETEPPTEAVTEDTAINENWVYVRDYADVLSDSEKGRIQDYIEMLYSEYLINAGVVTVSELNGKDVYTYADEMFDTFYGKNGNGLILVVNNDTNNDFLLKTGSCEKLINDEAESRQIFSSTKLFAEDNYFDGIIGMLSLSENCSNRVFDDAGVYSNEEIYFIQNRLEQCANDVSVVLVENNSELSGYDVCRRYCAMRYPKSSGYMILIDTASKNAFVYSKNELPETLGAVLENAWYSISEEDYYTAIDEIASFIG